MTTDQSTPETVTIQLTTGYVALVDLIDADLAALSWTTARWLQTDILYPYRSVGGKAIRLHRVVLERKIGRLLVDGEIADHISGDTLDNRRSNLRVANAFQNAWNAGRSKRNTTGFKGVTKIKRDKYAANIKCGGKSIRLGVFNTAEEAHAAYCEAARRYFGEFARFK